MSIEEGVFTGHGVTPMTGVSERITLRDSAWSEALTGLDRVMRDSLESPAAVTLSSGRERGGH